MPIKLQAANPRQPYPQRKYPHKNVKIMDFIYLKNNNHKLLSEQKLLIWNSAKLLCNISSAFTSGRGARNFCATKEGTGKSSTEVGPREQTPRSSGHNDWVHIICIIRNTPSLPRWDHMWVLLPHLQLAGRIIYIE